MLPCRRSLSFAWTSTLARPLNFLSQFQRNDADVVVVRAGEVVAIRVGAAVQARDVALVAGRS